jgi:hypothetical protein
MIKKRTSMALALAGAIALMPPPAMSSEEWDVTLTPYLWAAGIDGQIDIGAQSATVSYAFSDLLKDLNFASEALVEVNRGRWVNWAQIDHLRLENGDVSVGATNANIESNVTMLAIGTGYRFDSSSRSTIDVLIGMRYFGMDNKLKISGVGNVHGHSNLYDAILTLRPRLHFSDRWALSPTMSIGTGDTDLVFEMSPQLLYTISDRLDVRFGYRKLDYDFKDGSNEADITISGLIAGVGIKF